MPLDKCLSPEYNVSCNYFDEPVVNSRVTECIARLPVCRRDEE